MKNRWHVEVRVIGARSIVYKADTEADAEAWVLRDPLPLAQVAVCYVRQADTDLLGTWGQAYSRDRLTRAWKRGQDNYMVVDEHDRIVAAYDTGNQAIAHREVHEPSRFAWSVITSGQAMQAGLRWSGDPVEREFTSNTARVVVSYTPERDSVWLRIIELDATNPGEGHAEARLTAHQFRLLADAVPVRDWAGER